MSIVKGAYSEERVGLLKQLLLNSKESGKPKDYEIKVDGMKVVSRTNDTEQFDSHEDFITESTQSVTILVYDGASRNNTKHIFSLKEEPVRKEEKAPPAPTLSGAEIEKRVSAEVEEKVKQVKRELKYEQTQEENKELKEENAGLYEVIEKWKERYAKLEKKRGMESYNFGKIAGGVVDTLAKKNAHVIAQIPGLEGLPDLLAQAEGEEPESHEESEASFSKKSKGEQAQAKLSPEQKEHLRILGDMEAELGRAQLREVMQIFDLLREKPEAICPVITFIEDYEEGQAEPVETTQTEARPTPVEEKETLTEKKESVGVKDATNEIRQREEPPPAEKPRKEEALQEADIQDSEEEQDEEVYPAIPIL